MSAEDDIARVLTQAGARRPLPEPLTAAVRSGVEAAWRESLAKRAALQRRRRLLTAAAALVLATGLTAAIGWHIQHRNAPPVGIFLASRGSVDIRSPDRANIAVGGATLGEGTGIRTGPTGQALLEIGDTSVRVGPSTVVTLLRADQIRIDVGKIYLDFGARESVSRDLTLFTPFGRIEHLGTQFQADILTQAMTVSVREGHVRLLTGHGEQLIGMGEAAHVASSGATRIMPIAASGDAWAWTTALVPDFPIEGRTLVEFLNWYTRETGKRISYANPQILSAAQRTRLSGSIAGMAPDSALKAILASTQFDFALLDNGDLRLTMHGEARAKLPRDGMERLQTRLTTQN